jgi:hypothetical protein
MGRAPRIIFDYTVHSRTAFSYDGRPRVREIAAGSEFRVPGLIWSGDDDATPQAFSAHSRLLNRRHALPPQMVVPDSCALFPIRARYSRFVRAIPDSCALFPIRARISRFVRATLV